ncbi:MAG: hypothetical protein GY839_11875 [candidate division Zixibacteria bacterium]|nr:hypothetical protein [candidate division Zixibacteria bacterium]
MSNAKKIFIFVIILGLFACPNTVAQPQFEFCNNFIQNISFVTGADEGIERNLDDNFGWMQEQGYTHLRYFGIYANAFHTFPSPTLDANGYPTNSSLESVLEILIDKANQHGIIVNFDGWEVIAESNYDTTQTGFGYLTEAEVGEVVQEVLALGVTMISEEQFGGSYLQAIQEATSQSGAIHETTAGMWWTYDVFADEQLASVFSFYFYDQAEIDSMGPYHPANLANLHIYAEGSHYYDVPFSIAVGSFGLMDAENWKNVLLFAQIQYQPERFSIEEEDRNFYLWNPTFNFMDHVGNEIVSLAENPFEERPIVNLIYDTSALFSGSFIPSVSASYVTNPAIINTFTLMGYRVIVTVDSYLPDVDYYYALLAGGADQYNIAPLPDYVLPLLNSDATVFLQPTFGIPDENDAPDWLPVREYFGLPSGDTYTLTDLIPESAIFNGFSVKWGGASLTITPRVEYLPTSQIDTTDASVALSGEVFSEDVALIISNENKFLINSNVIHLEASYILSEVISGPLNEPAMADIAITNDQAIIFSEYSTAINLDLPWSGETHITRYNPQGAIILDDYIIIEGNYTSTLTRGELVVLTDLFPFDSIEYLPGDVNMANGAWPPMVIGGDVTYLVNYFRGMESSPPCRFDGFWCSADANGDCRVIGSDVTKLVTYFRGLTSLSYCTDFEPAWHDPSELPPSAPSGWPNCDEPTVTSGKNITSDKSN